MRTYNLLVEKTSTDYMTLISPAQPAGRLAPTHYPDWESVAAILKKHAGFTEEAAIRYAAAVEAGSQKDIIGLMLSDEDAAALGWLPEYE